MKKVYIPLVFVLAALAVVLFTTCNNPIMEKWWTESETGGNVITGYEGNVIRLRFETNGGYPVPTDRDITAGTIIGNYLSPIFYDIEIDPETEIALETPKGFKGWYLDAECTNRWDITMPAYVGNNPPANDVLTLYAGWDDTPITVHFNNLDGDEIPDQLLASGSHIIKPEAGENPGKGFVGWYKDAPRTQPWNFADPVPAGADMTLYAKWDALNCTVYFNANGGDITPPPQGLAYGAQVAPPQAVTKSDSIFEGWYEDAAFSGSPWNFDEPVTASSMVLYAKWVVKYCTVEFNANGGGPAPASQNLRYGSKVTDPPAMTQAGKIFLGWYTDKNTFKYAWDFSQRTVSGDMTLYAQWGIPFHTVIFDEKGANETLQAELKKQTVVSGARVIAPTALSKNGRGFAGWYTEDTGEDGDTNPGAEFAWNVDSPITKSITLYALWDVNFYSVTFTPDGGSPAPAAQQIAYGAKVVEPPAMTKADYGFVGWYTNEGTVWNFAQDTVSNDVTLTARWDSVIYTVTFAPNGGSPGPEPQAVASGSYVTTPPVMAQTGKSLQGWYTDSSFAREWKFNEDTVQENITLYARWETAVYTVTFNSDGGSPVPAQNIIYEDKVKIPESPTRPEYVFKGWYESSDPTNKELYDFDTSVVEETPKTLYARWVEHNPLMAWIPGGTFTMGGLGGTGATTRLAHKVAVRGFYMYKAEITQGAFHIVHWWKKRNGSLAGYNFEATTATADTGDNWAFNPSRAKGYFRPVESITWFDAVYFCNIVTEYENTVSRKGLTAFELPYTIENIEHADGTLGKGTNLADYSTNKSIVSATVTLNPKLDPASGSSYAPEAVGYRLPTEAEWEYAARGGNGSPGDYLWAGSNTANDVAWYGGRNGNTTQTQAWGQKTPNSFGIYDMSGNVCEWCWDWYDDDYYTDSTAGDNPIGPISSPDNTRVRRGGSIRHTAENCRIQVRDSWGPEKTDNWNIGFRIVRTGEE